jgi:hypothetical protein
MKLVVLKKFRESGAQELVSGLLLFGIDGPEGLGVGALAEVLDVRVESTDGHGLPGVVTHEAESFSEEGINHF